MLFEDIQTGGNVAPQTDPKAQAEHAAAPQAGASEDVKSIVLVLAGMMGVFYLLHITERWAVKI